MSSKSNSTLTHLNEQSCDNERQCSAETKQALRAKYVARFDTWREDGKVMLQGDMPGVQRDGLDLEFEDGVLTIHGHVADRMSGKQLVRQEYGVGDFSRTFRVGETIDVDSISAKLANGVLTIELPIAERAKPRKIVVNNS